MSRFSVVIALALSAPRCADALRSSSTITRSTARPPPRLVVGRARGAVTMEADDEGMDLMGAFAARMKDVEAQDKSKREKPLRDAAEVGRAAKFQLDERQKVQARKDLGFEVR
eukprot:1386421-Prymnesium_polylepis.1